MCMSRNATKIAVISLSDHEVHCVQDCHLDGRIFGSISWHYHRERSSFKDILLFRRWKIYSCMTIRVVTLCIIDNPWFSSKIKYGGHARPVHVDDSGGAALSTNEHSLPLFRYTMSSVIWPSCCEMFARFFVYIGNNKEIIRLFLIFRIIRELPVSIKYRFRSLNIWRLYICKRFSMFEPHYLDFKW